MISTMVNMLDINLIQTPVFGWKMAQFIFNWSLVEKLKGHYNASLLGNSKMLMLHTCLVLTTLVTHVSPVEKIACMIFDNFIMIWGLVTIVSFLWHWIYTKKKLVILLHVKSAHQSWSNFNRLIYLNKDRVFETNSDVKPTLRKNLILHLILGLLYWK